MALSPHYPRFRLTLDEPYDFAKEPGFIRSVHCHDFREDALSLKENVWRCPVTGLVFLRPSWLSENYQASFEPLASWSRNASLWEEAKRALDEISAAPNSAGLLSSSVADLGSPIDWLGTNVAALISIASLMDSDELQWALESTFTLAEDEGFVLHCNKLTDSMRRHKNWIALQWDNLQVHIRPSGQLAVYRWEDRDQLGDDSAAELVEEFFLSSPGEMADKDTYFLFLPIPAVGLLIYHSHTPQRMDSKVSSARAGSVKGHLVSLPSEERLDSAGNFRMTRASKVGIALTKTPRAAHVIGFHRLRFPSVGTYLDATFSLPYIPTVTPATTSATTVPTGRGSISGTLVKPDDSAAFAAGDRQGRVKAIFANGSAGVYTPFLLATYTRFERVMNTRDTTPLRLTNTGGVWDPDGLEEEVTRDNIQRLEFSESDDGRVEGKATLYAKSDHLKAILLRGDCTWKLERQDDAEADWSTICGGLSRWEDSDIAVSLFDAGDDNALGFGEGTRRRMAYKATINLWDMWHRFAEVHQTLQTAFDGLTIGDAINTVLQCSGFATMGGSVPDEMDSIRLPAVPKGENWRHGSQEGEEGGSILRQLLLYPRKQLSQFRLLYDWDTSTWSCEKVSKLTSPESVFWWFTPDALEARGDSSPDGAPEPEFRVEYGSADPVFTVRVYPPEANIIHPYGLEKPGTDAKRVGGQQLVNRKSIDDNTDRDYLGRGVVATPMLAPLADETQIAKFGRLVYDAIAHRRMVLHIPASGYEPLLLPGTRCTVRGFDATGELATLFDSYWLRRKTCVLAYLEESGDIPQSIYVLDEQWDLPID